MKSSSQEFFTVLLTYLLLSTDHFTHGSLKFSPQQIEKDHLLIIAMFISRQDGSVDCI